MTQHFDTSGTSRGDTLTVSEQNGERRYFLQGRLLQEGEWLELKLYQGGWLPVQFGKPDTSGSAPTGCIAVVVQTSSLPRGILFPLPDQAILRWPVKEEKAK